MATDPVCGMEVGEKSSDAILAVVSGKAVFRLTAFLKGSCSNECRDAFLEKKA